MVTRTGEGTFNKGFPGRSAVYFAKFGTPGGTTHLRHLSDLPPTRIRTRPQKSPEIVK
jgi:hypothetical protein